MEDAPRDGIDERKWRAERGVRVVRVLRGVRVVEPGAFAPGGIFLNFRKRWLRALACVL
jgi:hypothetical protein